MRAGLQDTRARRKIIVNVDPRALGCWFLLVNENLHADAACMHLLLHPGSVWLILSSCGCIATGIGSAP